VTTPLLRAIPESGPTTVDPSEDMLYELLSDVDAGRGAWLIVERVADTSGQTYAQALRRADGSYLVEHREGSPDAHFKTGVATMRDAHQLLTGWAFELPAWNAGHDWSPVTI
jgi:hypothetical protein